MKCVFVDSKNSVLISDTVNVDVLLYNWQNNKFLEFW